MPIPDPITTGRLLLRAFEPADAAPLVQWCNTLEVSDMLLNIPHPYGPEDAHKYLRDIVPAGYQTGDRYSMAVTLAGQLIGAVGLNLEKLHHRAEMGYWIAVPYWGNGYATEAAAAMLYFGFNTLSLNKIVAHHFPRNPASGRVLEKLGMQHEGVLRQHIRKWDRFEDLVAYGMLKADYDGRRSPA